MIGGTKVNALIDNTESYDEILSQEVTLNMLDETCAKRRSIGVQLVFLALKDKMKLKRNKDKDYLINLIGNLTSLV